MFKTVKNKVWAFDAEWVPDPISGRQLYDLPADLSDEDILKEMWRRGGATEEDPTPYLKTVICRIVSIAAVTRVVTSDGVKLNLLSLPRLDANTDPNDEASIVSTYLEAVGKHKPQLVGYNSAGSDIKILVQRGIANGIQAKEFCSRPDKPWEGIDYFSKGGDFNIDLMEVVGGWGKNSPSLNEMATVCSIPGKLDVDGNQVAMLWLNGEIDKIIAYNEYDALTTYLLWLRIAFFGGFFSLEEYQYEQGLVFALLSEESQKPERAHLARYLNDWNFQPSV